MLRRQSTIRSYAFPAFLVAIWWSVSLCAAARAADGISAADIQALKMSSSSVPLTAPRGMQPRRPSGPKLPREGAMITGRTARLVAAGKTGGWKMLKFDHAPPATDEPPRYVLPCGLLERMEAMAAGQPSVRFRIWGRSSNYQGKSYLLPLAVTAILPEPASAPASGPASRPSGEGGLLERLLRDKPERTVVPVAVKTAATAASLSVAPDAGMAIAPGRGGIVADRLARVLREGAGKQLQAHFESDNTLRDPPVDLLPCALLAAAEGCVGQPVKISGKITHYKGKRYLLLWKVLPERMMGRF